MRDTETVFRERYLQKIPCITRRMPGERAVLFKLHLMINAQVPCNVSKILAMMAEHALLYLSENKEERARLIQLKISPPQVYYHEITGT